MTQTGLPTSVAGMGRWHRVQDVHNGVKVETPAAVQIGGTVR
jgi:hypothetical protein